MTVMYIRAVAAQSTSPSYKHVESPQLRRGKSVRRRPCSSYEVSTSQTQRCVQYAAVAK